MTQLSLHLVTLGNGPRPEYETIFQRDLEALGFEPSIVSTHILDALSLPEIDLLSAQDGEPAILSRVRGVDGTLGNRPLSRAGLVPLIEAAIDDRENTVDATVICVAEYLPLRTRARNAILPFTVMVERLHALTDDGEPVALCPYGDRQRIQQIQTWTENGGLASERLRFVPAINEPEEMIASILSEKARFGAVLAFAYATEDAELLARFDAAQASAGCTIVLPFRETIKKIKALREARQ